jgi:hypothetical protein
MVTEPAGGARNEVVTVLGMHRSGTSLCAHMLHALGVDMADTPGESPNNAKGHWERARINDLNDQVFAAFGRGWAHSSHVLALPDQWLDDARVVAVQAALVAWLRPLVAAGGRFGFKDPRTARLMKLWRRVFTALGVRPRFVFCVRDPAQVARSISARDKMAAAQSEYRWLLYNAEAVLGVGDDPVCVVPYEAWFDRPEETARRLADFVGVAAPGAELIRGVVDPALRHDATAAPARRLAQGLHRDIQGAVGAGRFAVELRALCGSIEAFAQQVQPLLVEAEVLRTSVAEQNRVIADLSVALRAARRVA